MKKITEPGVIEDYLKYLANFAEEVSRLSVVSQGDADRVSLELDRFISHLRSAGADAALADALESSRSTTFAAMPRKKISGTEQFFGFLLLGSIGLWLAKYLDERDSERRKRGLFHFRQDMLALVAGEGR